MGPGAVPDDVAVLVAGAEVAGAERAKFFEGGDGGGVGEGGGGEVC